MLEPESQRLQVGSSTARLYQYAVLRVVPDVARGECLNAGVVLLARTADFLGLRFAVDADRWAAAFPALDVGTVTAQLAGLAAVAAADPQSGPIAALAPAQRFHWITSPASTVVQPGPVHTGLAPRPDWDAVLAALATSLLG